MIINNNWNFDFGFLPPDRRFEPDEPFSKIDSIVGNQVLKSKIDNLLTTHDKSQRLRAAWDLGNTDSPKAISALLKALEIEDNFSVKGEILISLGKLKTKNAIPYLIKIILNEDNLILRNRAIWALTEIGADRDVIECLELVLTYDKEDEIRQEAAWALGKLKSHLSLFSLQEAFEKETSQDLKKIIIWAIGEIGTPEAIEFLIQKITESEIIVKQEIIWILGKLKTDYALEKLFQIFDQESENTQKLIIWAIIEINSDQGINFLIKKIADKDLPITIQKEIIWILGKLKVQKSAPLLLKILRERENSIKKMAIWAGVEILGPKIKRTLSLRLKKEKSPHVRDEIKWALNHLK